MDSVRLSWGLVASATLTNPWEQRHGSFLHVDDFKMAIQAVSMEAGDADSNAAVAGALLGARLGYQNLPQDWLKELPAAQVSWFSQKIAACLVMLGLD